MRQNKGSEKPAQATLGLTTASLFWGEFASYNFIVTHDSIVLELDMAKCWSLLSCLAIRVFKEAFCY